jgi:regulator of sigma E protease
MEHILLEIWRYAQVALGIGLVIFVHESGHFLMARWCKVRVETFSLGFGPRIFGWRRGATTYQIAAVPLGGYVKMAGEESQGDGRKAAPDELPAKSVGQRFLIYSGGVIANVLFGLIVFPIVFAFGVPFEEPLLGPSQPGSPAWRAGLEPGSRVVSVNGNDVYAFMHVRNEVALGSPEEAVLVVEPPGSKEQQTVRMTPIYNEAMGAYAIGVAPAADPNGAILVARDSAAEKAGLKEGDRLLEVKGAPRGLTLEEQVECVLQQDLPIHARFERDGRAFDATIAPIPSKEYERKIMGVDRVFNFVLALRDTPLAKASGLREKDRVLSVNGEPIMRPYDFLRALERSTGTAPAFRIERDGGPMSVMGAVLAEGDAQRLYREVAMGYDAERSVVVVVRGSAAEAAGVHDGDRILRINDMHVKSYQDVVDAAKSAKDEPIVLSIQRAGSEDIATVTLKTQAYRPPDPGFGLKDAQYVYKAKSPLDAVKVGVLSSFKFIEESWLTLKRILLGHVSGSNIGGIITIGVVSHSWASVGFTKLVFFLCMLSINLAFLNVLPIPVLDGGHLFFLLVEKIKGSPVSERVLGYSQMVGVVLIISLMVYVTFNDVVRWLLPK